MFHFSNFGLFGGPLAVLADRDGFVPEHGDRPCELNYGSSSDDADWTAKLAAAKEATLRAEAQLYAWRSRQPD